MIGASCSYYVCVKVGIECLSFNKLVVLRGSYKVARKR